MLSTIISTREDFDGLKECWEELQKGDPNVTYYSTYEYIHAWWDIYEKDVGKELFIISVMQNNEIVGIAPLYIQKMKKGLLTWKEVRFLGKGDYSGMVIQREKVNEMTVLKSIFQAIEDNSSRWDRLKLSYIEEKSTLAHYLLMSSVYNKAFKLLVEVPRMNLGRYRSFEELERTFPKKTAKLRNKLQKEVGYQFKVISPVDEKLYQKIKALHIKEQSFLIRSKNRKERRSLFDNEKIDGFRKNTVCDNPHASAFLLESNEGRLLSYNLTYTYKNVLYSWNSAYDPEFEKYRLSKIRYYELFSYLFDKSPKMIFDFGAGRYPWKFEWTNEFTSVYELNVWKSTTLKGKILEKMYGMLG